MHVCMRDVVVKAAQSFRIHIIDRLGNMLFFINHCGNATSISEC